MEWVLAALLSTGIGGLLFFALMALRARSDAGAEGKHAAESDGEVKILTNKLEDMKTLVVTLSKDLVTANQTLKDMEALYAQATLHNPADAYARANFLQALPGRTAPDSGGPPGASSVLRPEATDAIGDGLLNPDL